MKKQLIIALAGVSLSALALTGCSGTAADSSGSASASASASSTAAAAELKTAQTSLGNILVDGKGMSVYLFDKDVKDSGTSACAGECIANWPAVTTSSSAPVLEGVTGQVGTIGTADGKRQITVNGMPLYYFAKDSAAGDTAGQGVNGVWWVLDPAGAKIGAPAAS
ncbi:MAG: hypothetical protein IIZ13_08845 [Renibacterium sp.]|nr:hypothetical protein [Renibacterium sp.]